METIVRNRQLFDDARAKETETLLISKDNKTKSNGLRTSTELQNKEIEPYSFPFRLQALRVTLYIVTKALNVAYVPLFIYRAFEKSHKCPPLENEILTVSAKELVRKMRRKEVSCETIVQAYIARIKEVNPIINAVIDERFDEALKEAREVDKLLNSEEFAKNEEAILRERPLLGVPLTVKGSIAVKGLKHTSGSVPRKDLVASCDAVPVSQARRAGAIPLLMSNVPEFCMNWETTNKLVGTTKNPYDSTRTCGGSSGGEASLIGSGASLIGIGSDVAGSLRLPAHYCGVWGHKPTAGLVSYEGHYPNSADQEKWTAAFTLGPMARYAGDLRTMLGVITKPEKKGLLGLDEEIDSKKLKIYYLEDSNGLLSERVNDQCIGAIRKVIDHFSEVCEVKPRKLDLHLMQYSAELGSLTMLNIDDVEQIYDNYGTGVGSELFRFLTGRSKHTLTVVAFGFLKKFIHSVSTDNLDAASRQTHILRKELEDILGNDGVFILPTFPTEAHKHWDIVRKAFSTGYMSIFNTLGFPVTNCPVEISKEGLPVGIQVVGLPNFDKLTLTVAEEIERIFGGWKAP